MTAFHIRLIAIGTMLIDHIGLFFFPDIYLFRLIGRLSFPLFAWLIANGAHHTKNISQYTFRLLVFALTAQPIWVIINNYFSNPFKQLNILFTLTLGVTLIICIKKAKTNFIKLTLVGIFALLAHLINCDYGAGGMLSIAIFYLFFNNYKSMLILFAMTQVVFYFIPALLDYQHSYNLEMNIVKLLQPFSILSLFIISKYNNLEGLKTKLLFYIFYPSHLVILYFLKMLLYFK